MNKFSEYIIKYRWFIIIGFIVLTAFFAIQLQKVEIDSAMKSMLPDDMPSLVDTDKIEEIFGGTDMLMILFKTDDVLKPETLKRLEKISRKINRIKGIDKVLSLFDMKNIKGSDGMMIVDPAVKQIPRSERNREKLRKEIIDNDIVYGAVVSEDFQMASVILMLDENINDEFILKTSNDLIAEFPGDEEVIIGGMPDTRLRVAKDMQKDMRTLFPIGLIIMLGFLYVCFRQLRGVILPFAVVLMSIAFGMGLIPLLGWKIYLPTIMLPVILIAVANDYGIHLVAKYQEDNYPGNNYTRKDLAKRGFKTLAKPVVITGVTTMVGMFSLMTHIAIPAKQLGILAGASVVYALAASLLFIPAILSLLPRAKPIVNIKAANHKKPILERMLASFGELVSSKPKPVIIVSLAFALISGLGTFLVTVDADPMTYYSEDSPVRQSQKLIDDHFGGSKNISVVFEGDIKDPDLINKMDMLEKQLEQNESVGKTASIARVVKQMSRALNDKGEKWYDKIPDSRNAVAQYFELYSMSGDPEDLEKLVDFSYEHAQLTARLNTGSTPIINEVVNEVREAAEKDEHIKEIGGFAVIFAELADLIVYGQLTSLFLAIILVSILLMILFRSFVAGIISVFPLFLSMAILFGLMGYFNIELNIATTMLSSIMIGVGIDYTIHFLWRYKEELANGLGHRAAVKKTLTTTGRGIVFNALSVVIGFLVMLISTFMPVRFFGSLVVVSILACLIGALIIIPSLVLVFKPKFLEPKL
ncbi:RND family transporter [Bacteroidota bacterium]